MIEMTLDTTKFAASLMAMGVASDVMAKRALAKVAFKVEGDAKVNISTGSRSGRSYRRGKTATHQASAAGQFPKTDSGELVASIKSEFSFNRLEVTVGSRLSAPHGFWLEYGTPKMRPRPWLSRTIDENKKFIDNVLEKTLQSIAKEYKR